MDDILRKDEIKICIVGAGKIAHSIVPALINKGYTVDLIISKKFESAEHLAEMNNVELFSNSFNEVNSAHNFFILSVPDGEISSAAESLARLKLDYKNKIAIHLSGIKNIDGLKSLKEKGALTGALHIMHTFPERKEVSIKNFPAAIESDSEEMFLLLKNISNDLKLNSFKIKPEAKVYYHLMGVFVSNFLTANFFNAELCREKIGEEIPETNLLLNSIVEETWSNIKNKGVESSLSGPITRGDLETVKEHISALKKEISKPNILLAAYIAQSLAIITLLERKRGSLTINLSAIKNLLLDEFSRIFE